MQRAAEQIEQRQRGKGGGGRGKGKRGEGRGGRGKEKRKKKEGEKLFIGKKACCAKTKWRPKRREKFSGVGPIDQDTRAQT